jgi:hypothetical protein
MLHLKTIHLQLNGCRSMLLGHPKYPLEGRRSELSSDSSLRNRALWQPFRAPLEAHIPWQLLIQVTYAANVR